VLPNDRPERARLWRQRARVGSQATLGFWIGFASLFARGDSISPGLNIEPAHVVLSGADARQQLAVTLRHEDGSLRDVTRECRFLVGSGAIATVTPDGVVRPVASGRATIRAIGGGLAAQAEVRVEEATRPRPSSFRADVVPLLSKAGCNMGACHGNLSGKGGFRLSLRGDDPDFDFLSLTHDQFGRRLSAVAPERSLIVLKPTASLPHEGGLRFPRHSVEAGTLLGGSLRVPLMIGPSRPGSGL